MKTLFGWIAAGALALGTASAANADTLDFLQFHAGGQGTTSLNLPGQATVTGFGSNLFVGAGAMPNSICSVAIVDFRDTCQADLKIHFLNDISNLLFDANRFNPGDHVTVTAYNNANTSIGSFDITSGGSWGFGALRGISWVMFDDMTVGDGGGLAFGNITYDLVGVPEPGGLPLLLLGLGLVGVALVRRGQKASGTI